MVRGSTFFGIAYAVKLS